MQMHNFQLNMLSPVDGHVMQSFQPGRWPKGSEDRRITIEMMQQFRRDAKHAHRKVTRSRPFELVTKAVFSENAINRRTNLISGRWYALWNGTEDDWPRALLAQWNGEVFVDEDNDGKTYARAEFEFCALQG